MIENKYQELSMLESDDVQTIYRSTFKDEINLMVKIEAIDREEQLLVDRIRQRWNRPSKTIQAIRDVKFGDFSRDIMRDPRYTFQRTKFNYGQIIE